MPYLTYPIDPQNVSAIPIVIDGGGSTITTGVKLDLPIPFDCVIMSQTMVSDQTGSIVVDIWSDKYGNYPPTVADSITASAKPTISSSNKTQDNTLAGWDTVLTAGDVLRINVDSVSTVQRVTLVLKVYKP